MTDPDCQETRPARAAEASAASASRRPGFLFSDRGWPLKLGVAVGLFALLCDRAHREISTLYPQIERGAVTLEGVRGKTVQAWARKVLAVSGDGFDIDSEIGPFHVTWPSPAPAAGEYVTLLGTFVEPRHVVASAIQVNTGYRWKRGLNYGLSSATVLAFLWIVRRRFRWRLSEGLLRGRY